MQLVMNYNIYWGSHISLSWFSFRSTILVELAFGVSVYVVGARREPKANSTRIWYWAILVRGKHEGKIAKRAKSKNRMQIIESPHELDNKSVFWENLDENERQILV